MAPRNFILADTNDRNERSIEHPFILKSSVMIVQSVGCIFGHSTLRAAAGMMYRITNYILLFTNLFIQVINLVTLQDEKFVVNLADLAVIV